MFICAEHLKNKQVKYMHLHEIYQASNKRASWSANASILTMFVCVVYLSAVAVAAAAGSCATFEITS
jgi:hypothetical protein